MDTDELVAAGRAAVRECRWDEALVAFDTVLASEESPEALDGLAEVRYWQGDYASAIELRERAYAGFRARGETRYPAKLAAYHLAFDYAAVHGNVAACQRVARAGTAPRRGFRRLPRARVGRVGGRARHRRPGREGPPHRRGPRHRPAVRRRRLEFDALAYAGAALVERGQLRDGMRDLDEAAAAAPAGR